MKKFIPVLIALAAIYVFLPSPQDVRDPVAPDTQPAARDYSPGASSHASIPTLVGGRQAEGSGTVLRILSDDNEGSRHQRFILQLANGRTLLIAHNIDLAPRIPDLRPGDRVEFNGEFEPNPQGGVIHWTHHDPDGQHVDGWLRHEGRTYQ